MDDKQNGLEVFQALKETVGIDIEPYSGGDPDGKTGYKMLPLDESHRMQVAALTGQMPSLMVAGAMTNAYTVRFPDGIQGHLMQYKNGGLGTPIQGGDGKILGHASLEQMTGQAAVLSAFNAMALMSGQYFLSEINSKLEKISMSLDRILEFLYGDKRAELLSEISFTKYAYENYSSIMALDSQRFATIVGLQAAKKVAIKDIEFYITDLNSATNGTDISDIAAVVDKAFQIKDSLELSVQLYAMATVLEMYYAQNHDPNYIGYIEKETKAYIDKCDKWILTDFSSLKTHVLTFKDKLLAKPIDKERLAKRISAEIELHTVGGETTLEKSLRVALQAPRKSTEYCISKNGVVYLKTA